MASTNFVDGITVVLSAWLNDVNSATYANFGDGSSYTGNLTIGSSKFVVTASSGDLAIGTSKFTVAGASGNLAINTNKFTVAGASGNTLVAGTLDVTGIGTFNAALNGSKQSSFSGSNNDSTTAILGLVNSNAVADNNTRCLQLGLTGGADMSGAAFVFMYDGSSATSPIGTISAASATTVAYNTSSDGRLKDVLSDFDGDEALRMVREIEVKNVAWKKDGHRDVTVIAQQAKRIYPYPVSGDEDSELPSMEVDYGKYSPLLLAAVKRLAEKVEAIHA